MKKAMAKDASLAPKIEMLVAAGLLQARAPRQQAPWQAVQASAGDDAAPLPKKREAAAGN